MTEPTADATGLTRVRALARGTGWRVSDIVCRAGPDDAAFEEAHAWVSIAVVLEGTFAYRSSHGRVLMTPGSVLLGNEGACFSCAHDHGVGDRCIAFHFDPAAVESAASDLRGVRRTTFARHRLPPLHALTPLVASVRALAADPDPWEAEETACRIASAALTLAHDGQEAPVSLTDEARVAAAIAVIERDFAEPLSLGGLAQALGVSRHHFLRTFRRVAGVTPYNYVLNRRLDAAAEHLRSGDGTVLDVALACGFTDLSEFTRRFGATFGRPPAAFRNEARVTRRGLPSRLTRSAS